MGGKVVYVKGVVYEFIFVEVWEVGCKGGLNSYGCKNVVVVVVV